MRTDQFTSANLISILSSSCLKGTVLTSTNSGVSAISVGELIDEWAPTIAGSFPSGHEHPGVVLISLPHGPQLLAAMFATWEHGNAIAPMSTRATVPEIRRLIEMMQPVRVVCDANDSRFEAADSTLRVVSCARGVKILGGSERCLAVLCPGDAWLATTSGTAGTPKCAVIGASAILANCVAVREYLDLNNADRVLVFTPAHFTYAIVQLLSVILGGGSIVAWPHGLSAPRPLSDFAREQRVSGVSANPTAFDMWMTSISQPQLTVRYVISAGQPFRRRLFDRFLDVFPSAAYVSGYGCTENTNRITFARITEAGPFRNSIASVGWPIPGTTVSIQPNSAEIVISGKSLMQGYLSDLQSGASSALSFDTGDLGFLGDAGELYLVGRITTRMNVGNEKVDPEEVETAVMLVQGISECAVGPLQDNLLGDAIGALVVLDAKVPFDVLRRDIRASLSETLRRSRWPHHIEAVSGNEIPRTSYGKIDRTEIRKQLERIFGPPGSSRRGATKL